MEDVRICSCKDCKTVLNKQQTKFCSPACSNKSRTRSEESRLKTSMALRQNKLHKRVCIVPGCGIEFHNKRNRGDYCDCCRSKRRSEVGSTGGKKSAAIQSNARRSGPEKRFFKLIKELYPDAEPNIPCFNGWDADIVIPSIKTAIHWNGRWHYEKITKKHSVIQVQNRDLIKAMEIDKMGWVSVVVRDLQDKTPEDVLPKVLDHIKYGFGSATIY